MKRFPRTVLAGALLATMAVPAMAHGGPGTANKPVYFERLATLPIYTNLDLAGGDSLEDETVAEISTVSWDGRVVYYSDSPKGRVGIVDIRNPSNPKPSGFVSLPGEPTSVATAGRYLLVAVNTSADFVAVSGTLEVYDTVNPLKPVKVASLPMGGQPDSVAVSPDGRYAAVAIENERDEDLNDGLLPQAPAGFLNVVTLKGKPANWKVRAVDMTGLAEIAGDDPEPEYVSINRLNLAAVTLQENNHVVLVNLRDAKVVHHFSAGSVELTQIDTVEDDVINPVDSALRRREPDAITWAGPYMATANEGDYEDAEGETGGSRGFTLFGPTGHVVFESGAAFEHALMRAGHYPESRSENKGIEPEGVAFGMYGRAPLLFVGSERGNAVGVYNVSRPRQPKLMQLLPTSAGPEGILPVPGRHLLIVSSEVDSAEDGLRSTLAIYRYGAKKPFYPQMASDDDALLPWGALSGLAADRQDSKKLFAVPDSYYQQSRIFSINAGKTPAVIEESTVLMKDGATVNYDLEGISQARDGSFWLASEGNAKGRPNMLIHAAASGEVLEEVRLPAEVDALEKSNGFEGVSVIGASGAEQVVVAFQREWTNDPEGLVRIGVYTPASASWAFFYYPLDVAAEGAWNGLSEITALNDQEFMVIERDNQQGPKALHKKLYRLSIEGLSPVAQGGTFPVLTKTHAHDLLPDLKSTNGWVVDKVEGAALAKDGRVYVVTDNDGVDDSNGETRFFKLGKLFR